MGLNGGSNDIPVLRIVMEGPLLMLQELMEGFSQTQSHLLGQAELGKRILYSHE